MLLLAGISLMVLLLLLLLLFMLLLSLRLLRCFIVLNEVKWQALKDQHRFLWLQRMVKKKASEL